LEKLAGWAAKRQQGLYHVCADVGLKEVMPEKAADKLTEFKTWLDAKREACLRDNSSKAVRELIAEMDYEGRSEEHTSELQSLMRISYAVFCLKKKNTHT